MSSASPSFGSNNPFRRKTGGGPSPSSAIPSGSPAPSSSLDSPTPSSAPRPPVTTFRTAVPEHHDRPDDPIQTKPKKIVKKVRVQSPPPSSPEDSVPVTTYFSPADYDDDDDGDGDSDNDEHGREDSRDRRDPIADGDGADPFNGGEADEESRTETSGGHTLPRAPPNPFSKTLGDLEQTTSGEEASSISEPKGAIDVNSFKRLLLTGYADNPGAAGGVGSAAPPATTSTWSGSSPLPTLAHDGASTTDASSASRQSVLDVIQDTARTSHEVSDPEETGERRGSHRSSPLANVQPPVGRKKPPPPSSRHGKLIKIELGSDQRPGTPSKDPGPGMSIDTSIQSTDQQSPLSSTSDVNKPLPLPPARSLADEQTESPFDREAAGKLPEAFTDASAPTTNAGPSNPPDGTRSRSESQASTGTSSSIRKPVAPPPRRHGRSDSKPPSIMANPADEEAPRSSMESNRSRADSLRFSSNTNAGQFAPPPPPRRPSHTKSGSSITSPVSAISPGNIDGSRSSQGTGFSLFEHPNYASYMATVTTTKDGVPKLSPPPPPPARQSSARRPPSIRSLESSSRKVSREKDGVIAAPPPPPRRTRSTKNSMGTADAIRDGSGFRNTSGEIGHIDGEPAKSLATSEATSIGTGVDILKDLEALQNEVNAAMGKP